MNITTALSFRSKGTQGAGVEVLRGKTGSNFESKAIVKRQKKDIGIFSCFTFQKGSNQYIVIKGPHVFVFTDETSSSPKYAIPLKHGTVKMHNKKGNKQVVALLNGLGEIEYEFKFDLHEKRDLGKNFTRVLKEQINVGNTDDIKEVRFIVL